MKKSKTILILILITLAFILVLGYLWKRGQKNPTVYNVKSPITKNITLSTVASGEITPKEEVIIRPNIAGVIDEIYVLPGDTIKTGDKIAKIKVIPTINNLQAASNNVKSSRIELNAQEKIFERQKILFEKGVISANDFDQNNASYEQTKQRWISALENYQIIKTGTAKGFSNVANTIAKSTIGGVVLEVSVEAGDQVIATNNFNNGTELATIADVRKMIFKGSIDESEVGKLKKGMPINIKIGALPKLNFDTTLSLIAPKGKLKDGSVQFDIEASLTISKNTLIRAGLSANANIILDEVKNVLTINEAWLQFDSETKEYFVEVMTGDQEFEKRIVSLGLSDGIDVEIKSGISKDDKIKEWNTLVKINKD